MKALEEVFAERFASPQNQIFIENVGLIVDAHKKRPIDVTKYDHRETSHNLALSSQTTYGGVLIDRSVDEICDRHKLNPRQLVQFAKGETVADMGAGTSDFLNAFIGSSETLAVDACARLLWEQRASGHRTIHARIPRLHKIESESVKLLNASWSMPFWAETLEDARETAREYMRILTIGGVALIGPLTRSDVHEDWEQTIDSLKYGKHKKVGPWFDGERAFFSHTLAAFLDELSSLSTQASLSSGYADIAFHRSAYTLSQGYSYDYRSHVTPTQLPNHLMVRKVA
ncbi:MAG TPA: hypothetical protein PKD15_01265 [Candidatus Saccharibacteria bacterium]|jgi:hypothetical protein|nr:hypothetical protein [Candidatus Saccharibacteria bacterium]